MHLLVESKYESRLLFDPLWGEEIGVGCFVVTVVEVLCLDPPLFDQFLQAVVDLPQADTHLILELSLGAVWILFQSAQ